MDDVLTEFYKWKKRVTTAYLEVYIFQLLFRKEHYAGEIVKICQDELDSEVKVPTVYAILNRNNQSGLIKIDTIQPESGVSRGTDRKYYALTIHGEEYYTKLIEEINRLNSIVILNYKQEEMKNE